MDHNATIFMICLFVILPIALSLIYQIGRCKHTRTIIKSSKYNKDVYVSSEDARELHYQSLPHTSYHLMCSKCGSTKVETLTG